MDYLFEDTTGKPNATEFCEFYDRHFIGVRTTLTASDHVEVQVFDYNDAEPKSLHIKDIYLRIYASLKLQSSGSSLGTVRYDSWEKPMLVEDYLRKPRLSRSSSRTFTMSDGQEYKWSSDPSLGHAWTCITSKRYLVAHYDLRQDGEPCYQAISGNTLSVKRTFFHLTTGGHPCLCNVIQNPSNKENYVRDCNESGHYALYYQ